MCPQSSSGTHNKIDFIKNADCAHSETGLSRELTPTPEARNCEDNVHCASVGCAKSIIVGLLFCLYIFRYVKCLKKSFLSVTLTERSMCPYATVSVFKDHHLLHAFDVRISTPAEIWSRGQETQASESFCAACWGQKVRLYITCEICDQRVFHFYFLMKTNTYWVVTFRPVKGQYETWFTKCFDFTWGYAADWLDGIAREVV